MSLAKEVSLSEIDYMREQGMTDKEIGNAFGVTGAYISNLAGPRNPRPEGQEKKPRRKPGGRLPCDKQLMEDIEAGLTSKQIGEKYGVTHQAVDNRKRKMGLKNKQLIAVEERKAEHLPEPPKAKPEYLPRTPAPEPQEPLVQVKPREPEAEQKPKKRWGPLELTARIVAVKGEVCSYAINTTAQIVTIKHVQDGTPVTMKLTANEIRGIMRELSQAWGILETEKVWGEQ